jgi:hypothetical protein
MADNITGEFANVTGGLRMDQRGNKAGERRRRIIDNPMTAGLKSIALFGRSLSTLDPDFLVNSD